MLQTDILPLFELLVRDSAADIRQTAAGQVAGAAARAVVRRRWVQLNGLCDAFVVRLSYSPGLARLLGPDMTAEALFPLLRELTAETAYVNRGVLAEELVAVAPLVSTSAHLQILELLAALIKEEPMATVHTVAQNVATLAAGARNTRPPARARDASSARDAGRGESQPLSPHILAFLRRRAGYVAQPSGSLK